MSRDVIFDETESANSDEINHLLSRLEKKNINNKGNLCFEKDRVSTEILLS